MGRRSAHPHPLLQDQMGTGGEGERPNGGSAGVWAEERHSGKAGRLRLPLICILSDWFSLLVPH